ncbi:MAG TPA: calcium-binding protein, partial [Sphingomonas sp.]
DRLDGSWIWRPDYTIDQQKDVVSYRGAKAAVTVDLKLTHTQDTIGAGKDYISNMEGIYGSLHGDTLRGDDHGNILIGDDGNDLLEGRGGFDEIFAGNGDDVVDGGAFSDRLFGDGGNDVIRGGIGIDWIDGGDGDDVLQGGGWAETFVTNYPGVDTLIGGAGADTYLFAGIGDLGAVNNGMGGQHAGIRNVVEFRAVEGDKIDLSALGLAFNGESTSTAPGIVYEVKQTGTVVHVRTAGNLFSGSIQLDRAVELYESTPGVLKGVEVVMGTEGDDHIVANADHDVIRGLGGHDLLIGGDGDDIMYAGKGDDVLDGQGGADAYALGYSDMRGSIKTVVMDSADRIALAGFPELKWIGTGAFTGSYSHTEPKGPTGVPEIRYKHIDGDTLVQIDATGDGRSDAAFWVKGMTSFTYEDGTLRTAEVPPTEVTLTEAGDVWQGGAGPEKVYGLGGNDKLSGKEGKDTLFGDGGNDQLYGGADADQLLGGVGRDYLDGGQGADVMIGGAGADSYVVDDAGDQVIEAAEPGQPADQQVDVVTSFVDYQLTEAVENLSLFGTLQINGRGNALDNRIWGSGGNNQLFGLAGNDLLDGNGGTDVLVGGIGDDVYWVDDASDQVVEAAGEGTDTVLAFTSLTLAENVERLELVMDRSIDGTGNALNNVLTGNNLANVLTGGAGDDRLLGGLGADTLHGGLGKDVLHGQGGADLMIGGAGSDDYSVDDVDDQVVEEAGGGASDYVSVSVNWTAVGEIEAINLAGVADLEVRGSATANTITGNGGANALHGEAGDDVLNGGGGNDVLFGGEGADRLFGSGGTDVLSGGAGNDVFGVTVGTDLWGDWITDFAAGDRIDLSRLDANVTTAANDAFTFIGGNAFTGTAGELRTELGKGANGGTMVYGDLNGDRIEDFGFEVGGLGVAVVAGDFML